MNNKYFFLPLSVFSFFVIGFFSLTTILYADTSTGSAVLDTGGFQIKKNSGIFTCDGGAVTIVDSSGKVWKEGTSEGKKYSKESGLPICNFEELIFQINHIINFIFQLIIPVIFILILYAGWLFLSGKGGNIDKAKSMLWNIVIGIFFMSVSFVLVKLVLEAFVDSKEYGSLLNLFN